MTCSDFHVARVLPLLRALCFVNAPFRVILIFSWLAFFMFSRAYPSRIQTHWVTGWLLLQTQPLITCQLISTWVNFELKIWMSIRYVSPPGLTLRNLRPWSHQDPREPKNFLRWTTNLLVKRAGSVDCAATLAVPLGTLAAERDAAEHRGGRRRGVGGAAVDARHGR